MSLCLGIRSSVGIRKLANFKLLERVKYALKTQLEVSSLAFIVKGRRWNQ